MTQLVKLIAYEEGWREWPYLCSEGYPTVGFGFKIGPKGASLSNYQFTLPRAAGDAWMDCILADVQREMEKYPRIMAAMKGCQGNPARLAVLVSMAYQMGVPGLNAFANTLGLISIGDFSGASVEMGRSRWQKQTPERAARHMEQMRSGNWFEGY